MYLDCWSVIKDRIGQDCRRAIVHPTYYFLGLKLNVDVWNFRNQCKWFKQFTLNSHTLRGDSSRKEGSHSDRFHLHVGRNVNNSHMWPSLCYSMLFLWVLCKPCSEPHDGFAAGCLHDTWSFFPVPTQREELYSEPPLPNYYISFKTDMYSFYF